MARSNRPEPELTSHANFYRVLKEIQQRERRLDELKTFPQAGRVIGYIVRDGRAEYTGWVKGRAHSLKITPRGITFIEGAGHHGRV